MANVHFAGYELHFIRLSQIKSSHFSFCKETTKCIWSIIAKCCSLRKEFAHQLCCLRPLPGVTDRTRVRKGGREDGWGGGNPASICGSSPAGLLHLHKLLGTHNFQTDLLCFPPADASVNHSPQQKGMIFLYKCAPFGAVQHAFIHHVMHDKLWNNNWK